MRKLTLSDLTNCIESAKENDAKYIVVMVQLEDDWVKPELIINPRENFDQKLKYFQKAYNEDLCLKRNPNISILSFGYGDSLSEIERKMIG